MKSFYWNEKRIDPMKLPQFFVGIAGKNCPSTIKNIDVSQIKVDSLPLGITVPKIEQQNENSIIYFQIPQNVETPTDYFDVEIEANGKKHIVPMRIFGEREFFITFVLQSNVHTGWNPRDMRQYIEEFRGSNTVGYRKKIGTQGGPEISGHAFIHHIGDEEQIQKLGEKYRYTPLESIFHKRNIPISWLIDYNVAEDYKTKFLDWISQYRDSIGYLPPSYFHHNHFSYNYKKSAEETSQFIQETITKTDEVFQNSNPIYSNWAGIDQWVGSIGTHFVKAAEDCGIEGLWGMGWDHRSCDTSMYHRGAPWNAYKPSKDQFRSVMLPGEKSKLWLYQWTIRDLVNTLPLSPYGSVCFSTDADDVKSQKILFLERNPTYWWKLLVDYKANFDEQQLDHFVFLVHQEDHDAHDKDDNEFMELFADEVVNALKSGEKYTIATMFEVTAWLNLKYKPQESNSQYLELHDPLSVSTRKEIQEKYFMSIARIYDPEEEEEIQQLLDEHWPATANIGTTLAYFDQECLWLVGQNLRFPNYHFNYLDSKQKDVDEQGQLIMSKIPDITKIDEKFDENGYKLTFESNIEFTHLPWVLWKSNYDAKKLALIPKDKIWKEGKEALVLKIEIISGMNSIQF
jgi:hypothetical protein